MKTDHISISNEDAAQLFYLDITQNSLLWTSGLQAALRTICEKASRALGVSRSSIWNLESESLLCLNIYDQPSGEHQSGSRLVRSDYLSYFKALEQSRCIDVTDANGDPRTSELSKSYFQPLGISALLDATLRQEGELSGVFCLEHIGGSRLWTKEEKSLTLAIADLIVQVQTHYQFQETVDRYQNMLSNMNSAAYRCKYNGEWTTLYISPGISNICGYKAEEFIEHRIRTYASIIKIEDLERVDHVIANAIRNNESFDVEYRIRHKNGSVRWVREIGRIAGGEVGKFAWVDGVINDITQQKVAEQFRQYQQGLVSEISHALAGATGETFFKSLVVELSKVLQVPYVFVGHRHEGLVDSIQTIAFSHHEEIQANFIYELAHTPCEHVIDRGLCCYPEDVQNLYPKDDMLKSMAIAGYLGTHLLGAAGNVLGVLVVLSNEPLNNPDLATELLKIFAIRASAELERLDTEKILRDSQSHYLSLFQGAGEAIFVVKNGVIIDCNPAANEIFCCASEEIIGLSPVDFSPELQLDGRSSSLVAFEKISAAMSGETQRFCWTHTRFDKTPFPAEVTLNCIEGEGETILLGFIRDVSEQSQAQSKVVQQRDQLLSSIESMPGLYFMIDKSGSVVLSNEECRRFLNKTESELKSSSSPFSFHPDDFDRVQESVAHVFKTGETRQVECRVYDADGKLCWLFVKGSRLIMEAKSYLVGAAIDITQRIEALKKLELSKVALQQRNKILQIANSLSNHLHGSLNEESIYHFTEKSFSDLPGEPTVLVFTYNAANEILQLVDSGQLDLKLDGSTLHLPLRSTLAGKAFEQRRIQNSDTSEMENGLFTYLQLLNGSLGDVCQELTVPIFDRHDALGAVCLFYNKRQIFSDIDFSTLESMTKNLAAALSNSRQAAALKHQAMHDGLTGLPNRQALRNAILSALSQCAKNKKFMALMLIDLDHFKEVNDTLGHDTGDRLICTIGPRIQRTLGEQNYVLGRLGGDEFALVFNDIDPTKVMEKAQQVVDAIRKPILLDKITLDLNASIGVALNSDGVDSEKEMLRRADVAMYHAKRKGGGTWLYSEEIDSHSREKLAIMAQLRRAIEESQFLFHYQPKIDMESQTISGVEALVRWQHPDRGLLYPDKFIELLEMSDLIHAFTRYVVRSAVDLLRRWKKSGQSLTVAVNVSTKNLLDSDFVCAVEKLCIEYEVNPCLLEFEITENSLITDPERVLIILERIAALGVRLSIDDFGTGYSSLAYLKSLPIHALKIDRTFVLDMESDPQDEMIVASTISMAHGLGLEVIAEGVETLEAAERLRKIGCNTAQGYYYSKPLPLAMFESYINASPYLKKSM